MRKAAYKQSPPPPATPSRQRTAATPASLARSRAPSPGGGIIHLPLVLRSSYIQTITWKEATVSYKFHDTKKEETSAMDRLKNRTLADCRWDKSPYA